jgi:hypothetical protein
VGGGNELRLPEAVGGRVQLLAFEKYHPFAKLLRAHALCQFFYGAAQPEGQNEGKTPVRLVR